jgi:hypothetical protein
MIALVNSGDLELNTRQIDDNKRFPELVVCMPKPNSCLLLTKKSVGMMEVLDRRGPGGEMEPPNRIVQTCNASHSMRIKRLVGHVG